MTLLITGARARRLAIAALALSALGACSTLNPAASQTSTSSISTASTPVFAPIATPAPGAPVSGVAGWNGDISTPGLGAAHRSLPIGSSARVTNLQTGQSAIVRVTSQAMTRSDRDLELSRDAAAEIGALQDGVATVLIEPMAGTRTVPRAAFAPTYVAPQPVYDAPRAAAIPVTPAATYPTAIAAPIATGPSTAGAASGVAYDPNLSTASIPTVAPSFSNPAALASPARAALVGPRFLQFGSFKNRANADRMVQTLRSQGLTQGLYGGAAVEQAYVGGDVFHRVRLGPIANADLAAQALGQARRLGHAGAKIMTP